MDGDRCGTAAVRMDGALPYTLQLTVEALIPG